MALNNYPIKWVELQKRCVEVGYTFRKLSFGLNRSKNYLSNAKDKNWNLDPKSIKYMANILLCKESDIAEIPDEIDEDYRPKVRISKSIDDICPLPFALNCSEMLSPVEIVKALPNIVDFAHWHKLEESPNPHIELKEDGMVVQRFENGNAILFTNEYIKPDVLATEMEKIRKWGLNESIRNP